MKRIRLAIIHQDGLLTGSATSLRFLLKGLDTMKFDLQVIVGGPGPLQDILLADGFEAEICPIYGFWTAPGPRWYRPGAVKNVLALFRNGRIKKVIKKIRPDIIHLNDKALIGVGLRLKSLGIPIVQHLRSTYQATHTGLFVLISKWAIRRYASLVVSISEDEAEEFADFESKAVIFNSMDVMNLSFSPHVKSEIRNGFGVSENEKMILFIGLFTKTKGAWDFVNMAGHFKRKYGAEGYKFVMVGPRAKDPTAAISERMKAMWNSASREAAAFEELLSKNNITGDLIFPGYRKDVLDVIHAADVVVICNRLGAMGRQAFEVLAVGKPLLITGGHSGKSSIVIDGKSAIVVKAEDYPEMARQLKKLAEDPILMEKLSREGRRHSELHFDFRQNGKKLENEYMKLLS